MGLRVVVFVIVCGDAVVVGRSHIHVATVLAGTRAIQSHTSCPARASARTGAVHVLQGLVFLAGIGVAAEGPDLANGFGHGVSVVSAN